MRAIERRLAAAEAAAEAVASRERLLPYDWRVLTVAERLDLLEVMDQCGDADELAARMVHHPDLMAALDRLWATSGGEGGPDAP